MRRLKLHAVDEDATDEEPVAKAKAEPDARSERDVAESARALAGTIQVGDTGAAVFTVWLDNFGRQNLAGQIWLYQCI